MDLDKLTASIQQHEGLRLFPYLDTVGKTTIGYGRNLTDVGITEPEATALLSDDIRLCLSQATSQTWWACVSDNDARGNAMLELLFVLGPPKLDEFVNTLAALRNRDYETAATEIINSTLDHQDGQRINTLAEMIRSGQFPSVS